MTISAIIIAKDAASTIARTLKSLRFTGEQIVIVDASTKDNTAAIAQKLGAQVKILPWQGYGPQKNYGAELAKGNWLLFVDDDEEITPNLANEIQKITSHELPVTSYEVYWLRIVTVFLGKPLKHLYGHNPRLFKKATARWNNARVHEQLVRTDSHKKAIKLGDEDTGLITEPLLHHSHPSAKSYLHKMHRYTTLDAQEMIKTSRHRSGRKVTPKFWLPHYLALRQFIKLSIYRRGLLDGYAGFIWCLLSAYYEYEMARKYLALCV